eukprot:Amastigsp_a1562_3.p5 type:complete len:108 gc:universal Amastigsp_a1562_3:523-846(+)
MCGRGRRSGRRQCSLPRGLGASLHAELRDRSSQVVRRSAFGCGGGCDARRTLRPNLANVLANRLDRRGDAHSRERLRRPERRRDQAYQSCARLVRLCRRSDCCCRRL